MVPYHAIAYNQQKIRSAIRRAEAQYPALHYGFVVHARALGTRRVLGVITAGGESLILTERMVSALDQNPLWLFGRTRISLAAGESLELPASTPERELPLSTLLMQLVGPGSQEGKANSMVHVGAVAKAETLVQSLLVLAPNRPAGWPL